MFDNITKNIDRLIILNRIYSGMDKLDIKILNLLNENARKSFRQIARELGVSMSTISNRVRKMEDEGIINGYIPLLDARILGYDLLAIIGVRISKGKLIEVQSQISKHDSVFGVYDITGEWDSLFIARFRNRKELNNFIKKIQNINYIERTYTQIVLNIVKEEKKVQVPSDSNL